MLTSVQEAAFAAFQEAATDLIAATGMSSLDCSVSVTGEPERPLYFRCNTTKANTTHDYIFGRGDSVANAVAELLPQFAASKAEPVKIKTAAQAVNAVRDVALELANEGEGSATIDVAKFAERLDALPLA